MLPHTYLTSLLQNFSRLILGLGFVSFTLTPVFSSPIQNRDFFLLAQSSNYPFADGVYLYGQSPQAEQIGQEYLVFKVERGRVIGAFYMPRSEFSCFYGNLNNQGMNLSIVDPYDNTVYPYSLALDTTNPLAAQQGNTLKIGLQGYHPISQVSSNDQRILNVCLQEYGN